ncbi:cytochrome c [Marinobacterium rhizophilum]|uniref:Cytochrome c n=1 Tax=Marinobacterium rhizophilum TaxID=420402 RepID=A0ABY5HIH2_9GAMM|nr:cytochrome c [Marinobacterium rhizophilum]UTW11889.1 cytochrome c [Marinobacterium rhizophilum]
MKLCLNVALLTTAGIAAGLWILSAPQAAISANALVSVPGNPERGAAVFHVGGCASCHKPADYEQTDDDGIPPLGGGQRFSTDFGTFVAPNISPDTATGIGSWSDADFANALLKGISPEGEHYYPAFPYSSYSRMTLQDIADLKAFMDTLPAVNRANEPHELGFPFSVRRGLGLWKQLYLRTDPVIALDDTDTSLLRGRYLVEGPGHCGECHSPRNALGATDYSRWLGGAANPDGDGSIPNISPHASGLADWSENDIAEYLSSGFTPEYDVVGSSMAEVVENTARLSGSDRSAIAAYLKAIPAVAAKPDD